MSSVTAEYALAMTPIYHPIPRIDPDATLDATLRAHPSVAPVFAAFAVDAQCAARTVRQAAREHAVDCSALLAALEWAARDDDDDEAA